MTKTSRYKGLVWVRFWYLKLIWFLETELGPPLFEDLIANSVLGLMRFYIGTAQLKKVLGWALKPDLQGGTGFNLLRVQFWTLVQRKRVQKGVRKWTPLKSKVVPPGGSSFGPFIVANLLKRLFQGWFDQHQLRVETWTGEAHFLRACFFLRFEDQKRAPSLSYCFASISIGLRPSRPASKPASKLALRCFVLISMVSRHWSSRLALRPAFNFVSSYKLFVLLQFPSTWSLEACLEAVPLRQLRPKILRQGSTVTNYFKFNLAGTSTIVLYSFESP